MQVRRRDVCSGTRLVRGCASRRTGGALHPDRQRPREAPRGEAGAHRGGAVRGVRHREWSAVWRARGMPLFGYGVAYALGITISRMISGLLGGLSVCVLMTWVPVSRAASASSVRAWRTTAWAMPCW